MIETQFFAFYGSLRRGMENYRNYKSMLEYLGTRRLNGFELYSLEEYPYAIKTSNEKASIVVEIFKIETSAIRQKINQMELDAGYVLHQLEIEDWNVGIYLYEKAVNNKKVIGGDWVEFFGISSKL